MIIVSFKAFDKLPKDYKIKALLWNSQGKIKLIDGDTLIDALILSEILKGA